jgi:Tol biopolymer transport system component
MTVFAGVVVLVGAGVAVAQTSDQQGPPSSTQEFVVGLQTHKLVQVTRGAGVQGSVFWASNSRVGEIESRGREQWIESQSTAGGSPRRLTGSIRGLGFPMVYSPAADLAATETGGESGPEKVSLIGRGKTPRVIDSFTTNSGVDTVTWSSSGRWLTYERAYGAANAISLNGSGQGVTHIVVYDRTHHHLRRLTSSRLSDFDPGFTPSGSSVVFVRPRSTADSTSAAIFVVPTAGGRVRRISPWAFGYIDFTGLAVAPDGRYAALVAYPYNSQVPYLFVLNLRSHKLRRIARNPALTTPSWSPDSKQVAFSTENYLDPNGGKPWAAVEVISPNGTGAEVLVKQPGEAPADDLAFSPDGRSVAFTWSPAETDS